MAEAAVLDKDVLEEEGETHEEVTHEYRPDANGREFVMVIAREESTTVDGRRFKAGALEWREPPIPLLFNAINNPLGKENGGHAGARSIAAITEVWRDENTIYGRGYFGTDEESQLAATMIDEGLISGVSADVGGVIREELEADDAEEFGVRSVITSGMIVSVTALPIQAFNETKISVVASGGSWAPPKEFFSKPELEGPTPLTITPDGRVYGHAATWGTCHVGYKNQCVQPPRSRTGYKYFNVGQVETAEGELVNVGRLTAGTNHATLEFGAQPAKEHYDNTGWAAAYVTAGEDEHGIWFSGSLGPSVTQEQIATLRAGSVSGDWRGINGALDMVGLLTVNQPGFPIPRAAAALAAGAQVSLVAPNIVTADTVDCGCEESSTDAAEFASDEVVEQELADEAVDEVAVEAASEDVEVRDVSAVLRALDIRRMDLRRAEFECCAGCAGKKGKKGRRKAPAMY